MVDESDYFSNIQKRTMLENAVALLKALRAAKDQVDQLKTYLKKLPDNEEYSTLIAPAISNYDKLFKIKGIKLSRKIYFHKYNIASNSEESEDFNINMPASAILANITKRNINDNMSYFMPS